MLSQATQSAVDRALRLEYDQALHLRNILAESQRELNAKLPKLAAGSLNAANLSSVKAQIDATITALEQRLASGMAIASSMVTGLESAQSITASQAGIPSDSAYWLFSPVLNVEVLAQQRAESIRLIRNVTDELRSKLLTQVQVSYSQGEGIGQMMRRLTGKGLSDLTGKDGVFRAAKYRAEMIGRTTVNELVNKAGLEAFKQLDSEFPELQIIKEWITTSDKRTSPRCTSLNGQKRELNEAFVAADGWSGQTSPAHVLSFVEGTTVVGDAIEHPHRYWYSGKVVRITDSFGNQLTTTLNHHILTDRGWITAVDLKPGDQVFSHDSRRHQVSLVGTPDPDEAVASIDRIFEMAKVSLPVMLRVVPQSRDLDQSIANSKVIEVIPDLNLSLYRQAGILKPSIDDQFIDTSEAVLQRLLSAISHSSKIRFSPDFEPGSLISALSRGFPLIDSLETIENLLILAGASETGTVLLNDSLKDLAIANVEPSKLSGADASVVGIDDSSYLTLIKAVANTLLDWHSKISQVQLNKVVGVSVHNYNGYCYDYGSDTHLLIANGVVAHNCRSRVISVPKRYNANSEKQWRIRYSQKPAERKEDNERKQIYFKQQAREESRNLPKTLQELTKPPASLPMSKQSARVQAVNEALGNVPDANKALRDLIDSDPLKFDRIMARQNELMQRSLNSLVNSDFARQLIADSDPMLRDFMQNTVLEFDAPKVNTSAKFEAYYKRVDQEVTLGKQLNSSSVRLHEYGHYLDHQMQKASQRVTEDNQFEYWSSANASGLMFNQDYRDGRVRLQNRDVEVLEKKSENAYEDFQEGNINADKMQRYTNLKDLVGSMTINRVSYGHRTEYYRNFGNAETEVFANSFQTYAQNDPDIREIYESIPYVPEVITYTNRQIRRSILDGSPYPLSAGRYVEPMFFEDVDIDLDL